MARPKKTPICPTNPEHGPMRVSYYCATCRAERGRKGGTSTLKRYGKEKMTRWGKKGGAPKQEQE